MYELVNEKLQIYSCRIGELTESQVESFLNYWAPGAKIESLTLFFKPETGSLVINRDNPDYELYLDLAEKYLSANYDDALMLEDKIPESIRETATVLKNCRNVRREIASRENARKGGC